MNDAFDWHEPGIHPVSVCEFTINRDDHGVTQLTNARPHERRTELRIRCEPVPMACFYVVKNGLSSDLHRQLWRQFRVEHG